MLHIPSYELGRMLARFDIASDNVKADRFTLVHAIDKALDPDGALSGEPYSLRGFEAEGGLPLFPLSLIEGYFFEVVRHQHAEKAKAVAAMTNAKECEWCGDEVNPKEDTMVVKTSELRQGDIVRSHGLRLLIDREVAISKVHPGNDTRWTLALVLNRDEVPGSIVPISWTANWDRNQGFGAGPHNGEHRWTIQGNDLARWTVERHADCERSMWEGALATHLKDEATS